MGNLSQSFLLSNIQRLITPSGRTKSGFLSDQAQLHGALLVGVTETWLSPGVLDSEVCYNFPGYSIFRCDREGRQGEGVALYLHEELTGDILCSFDNGVCELLVVMVHQLNTIAVVMYRPPDTRIDEFSQILAKLDSILIDASTPTPNIAIMGDFNFPRSSVVWTRCGEDDNGSDGDLVPLVAGHKEVETAGGKQDRLQISKLCDLATKYSLVQQVNQVTHGAEVLDLIFCNNSEMISSIQVESWPAFSDHSLVVASTSFKLGDTQEREEVHLLDCGKRLKRLDFNKANWPDLQAELGDIDWSDMEEAAKASPTKALAIFMDELIPILENHVPLRRKKMKSKNRMERKRKLLWRRLGRINLKLKTANSIQKLAKLLQDKSILEQQLQEDYMAVNNQEEDKAIFNMKSNPKYFFSFSKSRQKVKAKIGPFIDKSTGRPNPDPDFAAAELANQYSSVFVQPRPEWVVDDVDKFFGDVDTSEGPNLIDIEFTREDIEAACSELKTNSAAGADGVPACLLKLCKKQLSKPLYTLWRSSLDKGQIPADLLLVLISPVHKGGSRGVPKNYRPVALTSHVVKVFERVFRIALVRHLEENNLLPEGQHGFRSMRSTLTQLLSYWDTILAELEEGHGVDIIYTDFSKAFDKVETGVLLHKLRDCGIGGKVACWIAAFLDPTNRQQAVAVNGRISPLTPVISGVPQGTVLGPVLFLIHIRDIAEGISSGTTASSFADDTRVQRGISGPDDCCVLQSDLRKVYEWAKEVNMHFNGDKFECLRIWPNSTQAPPYDYLGPNNEPIEVKTSLKDLGVHLSADLSFKMQVEKSVAAASKMAGWGLRTFRRRSLSTMKTIWQSLVQPKLDYCSQLWSPSDQESINRIESVQKHFLSRIKSLNGMNYWEKLQTCKIYSQERRRERYIVIFLWKISQGLVQGYDIRFTGTNGRRGRTALPNEIINSSPASIRRARESSIGVKGAKLFNLLPLDLRNLNSNSVDTFKTNLDNFLSTVPDQPTVPGLGRPAESNSLLHQIPLLKFNL